MIDWLLESITKRYLLLFFLSFSKCTFFSLNFIHNKCSRIVVRWFQFSKLTIFISYDWNCCWYTDVLHAKKKKKKSQVVRLIAGISSIFILKLYFACQRCCCFYILVLAYCMGVYCIHTHIHREKRMETQSEKLENSEHDKVYTTTTTRWWIKNNEKREK